MAFVPENNENGEALDPYNLAPRERSRGNTPVKKSPKKKFQTKAQHQAQQVMAGKKRRRTASSSKTATYVKGAKNVDLSLVRMFHPLVQRLVHLRALARSRAVIPALLRTKR